MVDSAGSSHSHLSDNSVIKDDEILEPVPKKCKLDIREFNNEYKLEEKLNGILCCAVCLDVPCTTVYQVGHV